MSILAIGDVHITEASMVRFNKFLEKLEEHLCKHKYLFIVLLGDVLDTHEKVNTLCLNKAKELFQLLRRYADTFVLVGNHDFINNQQFLSTEHWLESFKLYESNKDEIFSFKIVDLLVVHTIKDKDGKERDFWFLPYVPDGRFKESIERCSEIGILEKITDEIKKESSIKSKKKEKDKDGERFIEKIEITRKPEIIFCHQLFDGAHMGIVASGVETWNYPIQIVSGHVHERQKIPIIIDEKKEKEFIYYTGSPLQHSFGEGSNKTISRIILKDIIEIEEIEFDLPKNKLIKCEVEEIKEIIEKKIDLEKVEEGNLKVKVQVTGSIEEFSSFKKTAFYKEKVEQGVKFQFKGDPKDEIYKEEIKRLEEEGKVESGLADKRIIKRKGVNFFTLLSEKIKKEEDERLTSLYESLVRQIKVGTSGDE